MPSASLYSTGPALIYINCGSTKSSPKFLGTFEERPEITIERAFAPVKNDLGGSELPLDRTYQGKEGTVAGVINRFRMDVLRAAMAAPISPGASATTSEPANPLPGANAQGIEGSDVGASYGALMTQENRGYDLWLFFPRKAVPAMSAACFIPGYHFLSAFLLGPDKILAGSGDLKTTVVFKCQRQVVTAGRTALTMTLNLFDHDMSAVANLTLDS